MSSLMGPQTVWDAMRRLQQLQRDVERWVGDGVGPRGVATEFPPINLWVGTDEAVVTAELPGVEPGSLDITALRETLTIKGERTIQQPGEGESWYRRERRGGKFARTVQLPFAVDPDQVEASYRDGMLQVKLTRPEQQRPRKIQVQAG